MESDRQVRMLGLGLWHGLLDMASVRVVADEPDPIAGLRRRGLIDEADATALVRILEEETSRPSAGSGPIRPEPIVEPSPAPVDETPLRAAWQGVTGTNPWDSLPADGELSEGSGRHVLRVLTLPAWKQYLDLRFVAEGGMGRVFKAYDPSLKRRVALKFLRRDDPELVTRFVLEAQHQAQVEHRHICRVYEVGEWQGQSYIAMQFIQGQTLEAAIPTLTLREKARIMEAVAEAVHAAHHAGLIHRDLKPANIMVSHRELGLEPSILDFGLARGLDAQALTQQGLAVGTLHYMAPEQARGDHAHINRRTDVYGLGATLHKVLTGEAPFAAYDGMEALRRSVETDAPSLRRLVPGLPEDLDTITRTCLEKDPARRYESALAVAEDLRRWREGEPILARRPSLPYLLSKWATRHRLVVAVAGFALLALLAVGGIAIATAASARAQARYAQHFGQEAERIEALLRYSRLLPPHDVRPEVQQARLRMAAMETEARNAGRLAEGPAAYALGRSHLALGEGGKAQQLLEKAWKAGLRGPEVSLALGRSLAAGYRQALDQAGALASKELREARERELAREFRDPALARLREGAAAALEAPAYHEALVAYMEGRWSRAQDLAREALAATPWLFEAKRLEGEVLLAQARAIQDPEATLAVLSQAQAAFAEARLLGPSDPDTELGLVRTLSDRALKELSMGRRAEASLRHCREAVDRVRTLQPQLGEGPARLAWALAKESELGDQRLAPIQQELQQAGYLSREAMTLSPDQASVLAIRINILIIQARSERTLGRDPAPHYRQALDLALEAQRRFPQDPGFAMLVATAAMRSMTWEMEVGIPPWASFEAGLAQARALRARFPEQVGAYFNLASLWVERAEFERTHGLDPRPSVAASLEALAAADARGLKMPTPGWGYGDAHLIQGEYLRATQGTGEENFREAEKGYARALQANPRLVPAKRALASVALDMAHLRLEDGRDPRADLAEADRLLVASGAEGADGDHLAFWQGQAALLRGRLALREGKDPTSDWRLAAARFQASARQGNLARAFVGQAEAWARCFLGGATAGDSRDRDRALEAARKALLRNPQQADAWLWIAAVEQASARKGDREAGSRAAEAWSQALALDGNLHRTALGLGMPRASG